MQTQNTLRAAPMTLPRPDCLGCRDCKGTCRDVIELSVVPDTVLHRSDMLR
ncbi:hypothetical protein AB1M95_04275 [Sulfitobacter sp. LCG007]